MRYFGFRALFVEVGVWNLAASFNLTIVRIDAEHISGQLRDLPILVFMLGECRLEPFSPFLALVWISARQSGNASIDLLWRKAPILEPLAVLRQEGARAIGIHVCGRADCIAREGRDLLHALIGVLGVLVRELTALLLQLVGGVEC